MFRSFDANDDRLNKATFRVDEVPYNLIHPAASGVIPARSIAAELCATLAAERLVPMLYAEAANPDSNKVYRNIGFTEAGRVADVKFI